MAQQVKVNFAEIAEQAGLQQSKAMEFAAKQLSYKDTRTTIPANKKSRNSFKAAQRCFEKIGDALQQESKNLKSMGLSFKAMDENQAKVIGK